jgi:uncharacterized membrane protein
VLLLVPLTALAGACAEGAQSAVEDGCTDAERLVTWDNWGAGFFAGYCRNCHSASTPERRGAPVGIDFDNAAQVQAMRAAIEESVLDAGTMPWGGGVPPEELERLRVFLACGS